MFDTGYPAPFGEACDYFDEDGTPMRSRLATESEAVKEYAFNAGMDNPDRPWILTPWDSWERNPHYAGPPVDWHPDDENDDEDTSRRLRSRMARTRRRPRHRHTVLIRRHN